MPNAADPANGIVTLPSNFSVSETLDRLEALLREKNIKIFTRIDQAEEAAHAGLSMPPTQLLLFGNPKVGTPIMLAVPLSAIELPLKALAWQDTEGKVWLSYNDIHTVAQRFNLAPALLAPLHAVSHLIEQAIS